MAKGPSEGQLRNWYESYKSDYVRASQKYEMSQRMFSYGEWITAREGVLPGVKTYTYTKDGKTVTSTPNINKTIIDNQKVGYTHLGTNKYDDIWKHYQHVVQEVKKAANDVENKYDDVTKREAREWLSVHGNYKKTDVRLHTNEIIAACEEIIEEQYYTQS